MFGLRLALGPHCEPACHHCLHRREGVGERARCRGERHWVRRALLPARPGGIRDWARLGAKERGGEGEGAAGPDMSQTCIASSMLPGSMVLQILQSDRCEVCVYTCSRSGSPLQSVAPLRCVSYLSCMLPGRRDACAVGGSICRVLECHWQVVLGRCWRRARDRTSRRQGIKFVLLSFFAYVRRGCSPSLPQSAVVAAHYVAVGAIMSPCCVSCVVACNSRQSSASVRSNFWPGYCGHMLFLQVPCHVPPRRSSSTTLITTTAPDP